MVKKSTFKRTGNARNIRKKAIECDFQIRWMFKTQWYDYFFSRSQKHCRGYWDGYDVWGLKQDGRVDD